MLALALAALAGCTPPNLPAPLPPLSTESVPPAPTPAGTVTIGVDTGIRGFNPYVQAQYSPAAAAISGLVLPSVFAPGATAPTDSPTAVVQTASVTSTDPFTVTYRLNPRAAWSDGTPIAAEDFTYLWQQMIGTPGVVSPGGYELISAIRSGDAGKTVEVVFATRFADWRTLFSPLLPARILKDQPGGFAAAMGGGIPVAGSVYQFDAFDPVIGQVTLSRNDKYWATETAVNRAVFREAAAADLLTALSRGDLQAVYLQPDATTAATLAGTGLRMQTAPLPVTTGLALNVATGHPTSEQAVRTAISYAVQGAGVREALAGGNTAAVLAVTSQLILPAEPTAPPTAPAGITEDQALVEPALTAAGFVRHGLYYTREGTVLSVVLGYPIGDLRMQAAAVLLQRQLGAAGIEVNLVQLSQADSQLALVAQSTPDLVLRTTRRDPSPLAEAVVASGCGEVFQAEAAQRGAGSTSSSTTSSSNATTSATATTAPTAVPAPGLPSGCDASVRALTGKLLDGGSGSLDELDAQLWSELTALPLTESTATLALGPSLAAVDLDGDSATMLWSGLLHTLSGWPAPA